MKPVFVLGVGAQKAGTTWLWRTLNNQEFSNMGFQKEYHIWDAKIPKLGSPFIAKVENPDNPGLAMRRMMQASPRVYLEYFQGIIHDDVTLTGDITPAYAFLDTAILKTVKNLLEGGGLR